MRSVAANNTLASAAGFLRVLRELCVMNRALKSTECISRKAREARKEDESARATGIISAMKLAALFVTLLFCAIATCAQSDAQQAQIKSEILKVMNDQTDAWNRGDIDGFMKGYWNSEKLRFVSGDAVTLGWQSTLDRYKRNYNSREKMGTLTFSDLTVDVLSKDAAVVLGSWALSRASDNPKGKFTLIFRKMRDGWRIVHDHTS